jgi:polar amino acid transport system substrate-binding protein
MQLRHLSLLLAILSAMLLPAPARATNPVRVSAGTWCPFVCQDDARPGALVELSRAAFAAVDIAVTFRILPWGREIAATRKAETDAIVAVAKSDVPDFVFPSRKIGRFRPCFFTGAPSNWVYRGVSSLKSIHLSVLRGTTYPDDEVNAYLDQAGSRPSAVDFLYSDDYLPLSFKMIEARRADVMLDDRNVVEAYLHTSDQQARFRIAGCLPTTGLWLAFSPSAANAQSLADSFDLGLGRIVQSGEAKRIYEKYGLSEDDL